MQLKIDEITNGREDRFAARNAARLKATDDLFHVREEGNRLRVQMGEMETQLVYLDNDYRAIQMNLSSDRGTFSVGEDDCVEMRGKILELTSKEEMMSKENKAMKNKIEKFRTRCPASQTEIKHNLQGCGQLCKGQRNKIRLYLTSNRPTKCPNGNCKEYLDMLLDVNDEICDTVMARELARSRTLRLAGRVNLPPRLP